MGEGEIESVGGRLGSSCLLSGWLLIERDYRQSSCTTKCIYGIDKEKLERFKLFWLTVCKCI